MDESKLKNLLKASLSEADFPPERRLAVLRAVREKERKDGTMIKGKISMVLILALALVLATCGLAAAAGGISAAVFFSLLAAVFFKSKSKD